MPLRPNHDMFIFRRWYYYKDDVNSRFRNSRDCLAVAARTYVYARLIIDRRLCRTYTQRKYGTRSLDKLTLVVSLRPPFALLMFRFTLLYNHRQGVRGNASARPPRGHQGSRLRSSNPATVYGQRRHFFIRCSFTPASVRLPRTLLS